MEIGILLMIGGLFGVGFWLVVRAKPELLQDGRVDRDGTYHAQKNPLDADEEFRRSMLFVKYSRWALGVGAAFMAAGGFAVITGQDHAGSAQAPAIEQRMEGSMERVMQQMAAERAMAEAAQDTAAVERLDSSVELKRRIEAALREDLAGPDGRIVPTKSD